MVIKVKHETKSGKQLCGKTDCVLADKCMRQLHFNNNTETFITIVNPAFVSTDGNCDYFFPEGTTRFGKGFIKILRTLPRIKEEAFRDTMISHYPRNKYFKMRKGEVLCNPEDQERIHNILHSLGVDVDDPFDEWEERNNW